jgi:hypothetical protein
MFSARLKELFSIQVKGIIHAFLLEVENRKASKFWAQQGKKLCVELEDAGM